MMKPEEARHQCDENSHETHDQHFSFGCIYVPFVKDLIRTKFPYVLPEPGKDSYFSAVPHIAKEAQQWGITKLDRQCHQEILQKRFQFDADSKAQAQPEHQPKIEVKEETVHPAADANEGRGSHHDRSRSPREKAQESSSDCGIDPDESTLPVEVDKQHPASRAKNSSPPGTARSTDTIHPHPLDDPQGELVCLQDFPVKDVPQLRSPQEILDFWQRMD